MNQNEETKADIRAIDCNTPDDWALWLAQRREYEDPCGYERGRDEGMRKMHNNAARNRP